jgi:hypothetical protein
MAIGRNDNYVQLTFTADTFRKRRKRENSSVGPGLCPDGWTRFHVLTHNQKTDTTAQLYCTLSMCVTPKTISRQNQNTNTPPQLYCTLSSTCICRSTPFSHQNQKLTQHNSTTGKKVPPAHANKCI